jgi:UDP-N-acetylmuramoylalanine--D-glutamate ligase
VVGNIGEPVLDALAKHEHGAPWPDAFVVELSSFQLETTSSLSPTAAAVLNVTDNHLDRYPGIDAYAAAKRRIFSGGGEQVLNRDDPRSLAMRIPGRAVQTFGAGAPATGRDWGLVQREGSDGSWLARGEAPLIDASDLALVGRHNALNALAALALTSTISRIDAAVLAALAAFQGLPHRMERVADIGGILYVNDSKGTTVAATAAALEGMGRRSVLIAGGDGKGQDFLALKPSVERHCRAVVLLGRDAPAIAARCRVWPRRSSSHRRSKPRWLARSRMHSPATSSVVARLRQPRHVPRLCRARRPVQGRRRGARDGVRACLETPTCWRHRRGCRRLARFRARGARCSTTTSRWRGHRSCCSRSGW